MKRLCLLTIFITGLILSGIDVKANGLVISNLSRNAADQTVTFDISWNNSWRVDSSGAPYNWDAAWVFVKYRQCGAAATTAWTHAKIDTGSVLNSYGSLEPHASYSGQYYTDSLGVMLRRGVNGIFPSNGASTVTLRLANILTTGSYDVKVFGIEMVFVPEGAFEIGTASTANSYGINDGTTGAPVTIASESPLTVYMANSNYTNYNEYRVNLGASYPKGFKSFYCMKYEISQGQYCAFLNTLTTPMQLNRYLGYYNSYRNRSINTGVAPDIYFSYRPDRAQNCMDEDDLLTYLDWAALRPMTEMEYEKACRGEAPSVDNEYAWGTNSISQATTISTSPEDGTERVSSPASANACFGNNAFGGGDGGNGPLRVGIFADPTDNDRVTTGATFYGIMEMSGNVHEICKNVGYTNTASNYDGHLGNGVLSTTGVFDEATWSTGTTSFILKGGSHYSSSTYLRVSMRYFRWTDPSRTYDGYSCGGRGVR